MRTRFQAALLLGGAVLAAGAAHADVTVSKQPTKHISCDAGVCSPTAQNAVLNTTDLAAMLDGGDVKVTTGSGATNIIVKDSISWASTSRLTLDANQSVTIEKPVVVTGTGAATITTNDGGTGGDLIFNGKGNVTFWDLTSGLIINGNSYTLVGDIATLASDIANSPAGFYALASDYRAKHPYHGAPIQTNFAGTFEGLGHTISKLTINHTHARDFVGLFRQVYFGAIVRDLGLVDVSIIGLGREFGTLIADATGVTVFDCYATGSITATGAALVGGLIGGSADAGTASIKRSFAAVDISAPDATGFGGGPSAVGGLVGILDSYSVTESYATGAVIGGEETLVGGLIGYATFGSGIRDSYAVGATSGGASAHVGGLIGDMDNSSGAKTSYSTGEVAGGKSRTQGGFVGTANFSFFTDDYWDVDTSGDDRGDGKGCRKECKADLTGLTTEQLTSALPTGFDLAVWGQNPTINGGYPYLLANPPK